MAEVTTTHSFDVSQDDLWKVLADPSRFEEWLTIHTKWKSQPPAELSQGATMSEVLTIMNMPNTIDFTVTDFDAPNRTSFSGTGMAGAKITFTLRVESTGENSSAAHIDATFESQMMVGAVGAAIQRATKKELEASLDKLATIVS